MNRREFHLSLAGLAGSLAFQPAWIFAAVPREFRFSVMLWTLEKTMPVEQCIETVARAGYEGVELVGEFFRWSADEMRNFKAKMRSPGLVVDSTSGIKTSFADPKAGDELVKEFLALIPFAKELGCPQVILLSGPRIEGMPREQQYRACVENLKRVAGVAGEHGMNVVIEPIDPLEDPKVWLTTVVDGFRIAREVGRPNLRVLYDFYHEQRGAGNLIEKLGGNIDLIGLVHIADVPGRHEPGTGEIDYANIYRKLAELKYDRFIAMEVLPTGDPVASLKAARLEAQRAGENGR